MSTFTAHILKGAIFGRSPHIADDKIATPNTMAPAPAGVIASPVAVTSMSKDVGPIGVFTTQRSGFRIKSFYDEWYNRMHISPVAENFGTIVKNETFPVNIWNAFIGNVSLNWVSDLSAYGITFPDLSLPLQFDPLAAQTVYMEVDTSGPAQINTTAEFQFAGSATDTIYLPITGQRSRLFEFLPDWSQGVQVQLEFLTNVLTARDGTEQRRGLRQTPRRTYSMTVGVSGERKRSLRNLLLTWQPYALSFPDPVNFATVATASGAGAQTLVLKSVPDWMTQGIAVVITDGSRFTMSAVESVSSTGNTVTLSSVLQDAWGPNTTVHLMLTGRMAGDSQAVHQTDSVTQYKIKFTVDPTSYPVKDLLPAGNSFMGREFFDFKVSWTEEVGDSIIWPRDAVDYGFGKVEYFVPVNHVILAQKSTVACNGAEEVRRLQDFFCRQYGMLREFYAPTNIADMVLASPLQSGASAVEIVGSEVYDYYADNDVFGNINIVLNDGSTIPASVKAISLNSAGNTVMQLNSDIPQDVPLASVNYVSWLNVVRFGTDALTIGYKTDSFATITCAMQTLPNATAEVSP